MFQPVYQERFLWSEIWMTVKAAWFHWKPFTTTYNHQSDHQSDHQSAPQKFGTVSSFCINYQSQVCLLCTSRSIGRSPVFAPDALWISAPPFRIKNGWSYPTIGRLGKNLSGNQRSWSSMRVLRNLSRCCTTSVKLGLGVLIGWELVGSTK